MTRFSIRELMLLMVVVGLAFGWWLHIRRTRNEITLLRAHVAEKENLRIVWQLLRRSEPDLLIFNEKMFDIERRLEVQPLVQPRIEPTPPMSPLHLLILEGDRD